MEVKIPDGFVLEKQPDIPEGFNLVGQGGGVLGTLEAEYKKTVTSTPEEQAQFSTLSKETMVKDPEISLKESIKEGVKNIPGSYKKQISSLYEAVTSPAKTWDGLKALTKDIYKNQMEIALRDMGFNPEEIKFKEGAILEEIEKTPVLDATIEDLKKPYTSYDEFKKTFAKDPARIITDIASIAAPVARVAEATAMTAKATGIAKTAEMVGKAAALTEPLTPAVMALKKGVGITSKLAGKKFGKLKPTELYKGATKMSTVLSETDRSKLAQIALDQEIMPTLKGLDKIDKTIETLDSKIADLIDKAQQTGAKIKINDLFSEFDNLKEAARISGTGKESISAIKRVKKSIVESNLEIGRKDFTPEQAQQLKKTIYRELESYYDKLKNSPAKVEAKKAVARSSKEFLESLVPEIKQLNKADGDLIKLRRAIEGPVSRISNRNLSQFYGAFQKGGAGSLMGYTIGGGSSEIAAAMATVGVFMGILDDPTVKARLSIVLNKLQKKGIEIPVDSAIKRILAEKVIDKTDKEQ